MNLYPRDTRGALARIAAESRALLEISALLAVQRELYHSVSAGNGQPVILVPGFTATDRLMGRLRRFLNDCGYRARGWGQGRNLGVRRDLLDGLAARVRETAALTGRPVTLIGWSGGGMYARACASLQPDQVRQVITLGTPFKLTEDTLHYLPRGIYRLHQRLSPGDSQPVAEIDHSLWYRTPPVPSTSLYSEQDALSPWPFCLDPRDESTENIHLRCSHAAMPYNPLVYHLICDRLAQPEAQWAAFEVTGWRRRWYSSTGLEQFPWGASLA